MGFPILSAMIAIPAVAAVACLFAGAKGARWIALLATLINFALGIVLWTQFEIGGPQWQFVEHCRSLRALRLGVRYRRYSAAADRAVGVPDADLHRRIMGSDHQAGTRIYGGVPADGNADDRRVRGTGFVPVLHLLRSRPDPDVPDHRDLGRRGPHLRQLQILPLHAARFGADADRDAVDGERSRHHEHPGVDGL